MNLWSDPCAYIQQNHHSLQDSLEILTVWVDDLLQFTSNNSLGIKLQDELSSIFELTDMGGPSKVVGIEISQGDNSITISQNNTYYQSFKRRNG